MPLKIDVIVMSDLQTVWDRWTKPEHIKAWNAASDDWHTTKAEVDLKPGGSFYSRMEAKDGSYGFDLRGTYHQIVENELIEFSLEDGRMVTVKFEPVDNGVKVIETFDPENENSEEAQKAGWQSILNNFAKYVESR